MTTATTMTTILWPLHRTICVSRHPQLRSRGFCWSKVLLRTCCCWHLAHLDARVLLNGVTCTVCIPWAVIITTIVIIWQLIWHCNMSELLQEPVNGGAVAGKVTAPLAIARSISLASWLTLLLQNFTRASTTWVCTVSVYVWTRMCVNAQRDGRSAEYRWRPPFNAAKFGWRPLLECREVTLPIRKSRWNLQGCPKLANGSQPLVGRSSPY